MKHSPNMYFIDRLFTLSVSPLVPFPEEQKKNPFISKPFIEPYMSTSVFLRDISMGVVCQTRDLFSVRSESRSSGPPLTPGGQVFAGGLV